MFQGQKDIKYCYAFNHRVSAMIDTEKLPGDKLNSHTN